MLNEKFRNVQTFRNFILKDVMSFILPGFQGDTKKIYY